MFWRHAVLHQGKLWSSRNGGRLHRGPHSPSQGTRALNVRSMLIARESFERGENLLSEVITHSHTSHTISNGLDNGVSLSSGIAMFRLAGQRSNTAVWEERFGVGAPVITAFVIGSTKWETKHMCWL